MKINKSLFERGVNMKKPDTKVIVGSVVCLGLLGGVINIIKLRKKDKERNQHILNTVRRLMAELDSIGLDDFMESREI